MNEQIQEIRYQVGEAWKGTYNAATTYGNANVVQDATGLSVYRSLKSGNVGHPLTDPQWWFCIIDLSSIKQEADHLQELDTQMSNNEAERIENEQTRVSHEQARVNAEANRIYNEQQRENAETARIRAEQDRVTQENQRIGNEQGRVGAEQRRVSAEQQRVNAESIREAKEEQRQINENNRVAAEADRVQQYAADHQQAVEDHQQAESDHTRAGEDHTRAEGDHTTADNDHTRAGEDHTQAGTDHTRAESDHTQAGNDHTRAGEDHTTAGSDHTRAGEDHTASVAATEAANAAAAGANALQTNLENGNVIPKLSTNLESWEDREDLSVNDTWTDVVRTTAGDTSIVSSKGAKLVSIAAKTDFYAQKLRATGFNLLHSATAVGAGYYFLVPALSFGVYGTAEKPNGLLFTDNNGNNLTPTVYFKPLSSGVPTSVTDGTACSYTDSNGLRFYTTTQPGYIIVSGITFANTCAHVAWSRRYNEFVSPTASADAGSEINIGDVIHALHDFDLMLTVGSISDSIAFAATVATWTRRVSRVKPEWVTEPGDSEGTYVHTATISGMKDNGAVSCGAIALNVDGKTISYTDTSADATTDWVKYELATIATGTVNISNALAIEDWGLELLVGATGQAYITTQYAQSYPDSLAAIAAVRMDAQMQVVAEALTALKAEHDAFVMMVKTNMGNVNGITFDAQDGFKICGQKMFDLVTGAPTEIPVTVGLYRFDASTGALYVSKSVTNSTSDWKQVV